MTKSDHPALTELRVRLSECLQVRRAVDRMTTKCEHSSEQNQRDAKVWEGEISPHFCRCLGKAMPGRDK